MAHYNLALLGFGNVGKALAKLLLDKRDDLLNSFGITISITGIATARHGSVIDYSGVDVLAALNTDDVSLLSKETAPKDSFEFIRMCNADVLFENTPVDYQKGEPALSHLRLALELGMHAITANKGPVVYGYKELTGLATAQGKSFFFESAVMDGAPIFSLFRETLPAATLRSFRGVLNSTTNMILTRMEHGQSFDQAVQYCREIGIAETDPSGDIDGWDAAIKVTALVNVLMRQAIKPVDVKRKGIRDITLEQVKHALQDGERWKLICRAENRGGKIVASVAPELVEKDSAMYSASGTTSVIEFESDVLGLLTIVEQDPGPSTTAYGLFADFINAVRS